MMKTGICVRNLVVIALAGSALAGGAALAQADYPSHSITMIVAFPPGGGVDNVARRLAEEMSKTLGQTMVIENKGGAGGNIAAGAVANSKPDGYTLLFTAHAGLVIAKATKAKLAFDPVKDLAPVTFVASSAVALTCRNDFPANSYQEFIAYAKKNPGKINFGSNGVGSSYHLALEKIKLDEGVNIVHIPFQGGMPSQIAMMGGEIDCIFASLTQSYPALQAKRIKPIAIAGKNRTPLLPDVPTIAEAGSLPKYDQSSNTSLFVRAGTPPEIIAKLNAAAQKAMTQPNMKTFLDREGITYPGDMPPAEFGKQITDDVAELESLIKRGNLSFAQ